MKDTPLVQPSFLQLRMIELGKKDRCCRCHHPLSECPYYEENDAKFTQQEKARICNELSGATI